MESIAARAATRAFVYVATHRGSTRHYVGKAVNIARRWNEHVSKTTRRDTPFGNALRKYGRDAFDWLVVDELATEDEAYLVEAWWIAFLRSHVKGYGFNLATAARGSHTLAESTKEKLRKANLGKKATPEARARMSIAGRGKKKGPRDEATKALLSAKAKQRCAAGLLPMKGKRHSAETIQKMRVPRPGTSAKWRDPEWRAKTLAARAAAREARTPSLPLFS